VYILVAEEGRKPLNAILDTLMLGGTDTAPPTGAPLIVDSPVIAPPATKATDEIFVRAA
jgi:hypothetical protein